MARNFLRPIPVVVLSAVAVGCVTFQVVDLAVTSAYEEPWPDLDWLEADTVTRIEVSARLGKPQVTRQDGRLVVYGMARKISSIAGTYRVRFLFLEFDAKDLLSRYRLTSDQSDSCGWDGICVEAASEGGGGNWGRLLGMDHTLLDRNLVLTAPDDQDATAKTFRRPAERCALYVYSEQPGSNARSERLVHIDPHDRLPMQTLSSSTFIFWLFEPGEYAIDVYHSPPLWHGESNLESGTRRPFDFDCPAGTAMFLRATIRKRILGGEPLTIVALQGVDPDIGHEAILARRRVLEND